MTFADGSTATAKVIREDFATDSALLRVEIPTPGCASATDDKLAVGADVFAIGSPLGN